MRLEPHPQERAEAYTYGKLKQDQLVVDYSKKYNLPYVLLRPSVVFGPGKKFIPSRIGIDTFGFFIHIGGNISLPLTYVDNCAEAIVLAGLKKGVNSEVFNIVDDDLPTSRQFLTMYKKHVDKFFSVYMPYPIVLRIQRGLGVVFQMVKRATAVSLYRNRCKTYWNGNRYSNEKAKLQLGWSPRIPMDKAMQEYFRYQTKSGGK